MDVQKIFHANAYLDGTNSLLGRASELTLPELVATTTEHTALGMFGKVELATGIEPMVTKVKWNGFYADRVLAGSNPFIHHKLQLRGNCEVHNAAGLVGTKSVVALMTVKWKKSPMGVFAPQTSPDFEDELSTTYFKLSLDGKELVEVDVLNQIWKVDGKDILQGYRANLGL